MQTLWAFIKKEFLHVFRDQRTLLLLFGLPAAQILLFGFALSSEVKNIRISIWNQDHSQHAQQIMQKIATSRYFMMQEASTSYDDIDQKMRSGAITCALVIPSHLGSSFYQPEGAKIQLIADGADPNTAATTSNYLKAILASYQQSLNPNTPPLNYHIETNTHLMYNPEMNGSLNFVPGVIALIFLIVCTTLSSVSVVKEKEMGTMEILLVSPLNPLLVLLSKALPYLVLSIINLVFILFLSEFLLNVHIQGSIALVVLESLLFIIACLSLGLLISNLTNSQQAAMMISMMGMMLPTILLTGFLFPLENMPQFFQYLSHIVPSRYFYSIMKAVMLKGLGFSYVWKETLILLSMTILLLSLALRNFKSRLV